jgi:hypothetical protein
MIKDLKCPQCGRLNKAHDSASSSKVNPDEGDVALCWTCLAPSIFVINKDTGEASLREPTTDEYILLNKDPQIGVLLQARKVTHTPLETIRKSRRDSKRKDSQ